MLYDILVIDEVLKADFSEVIRSIITDNSTPPKISDTSDVQVLDAFDMRQFVLKLIKENLRVTWTTGEMDDLEHLTEKDLSSIRYIFLDLELEGTIQNFTGYKSVNAKILGIFKKIDARIKSSEVTCFINSTNYNHINYGSNGKEDLQQKFTSEFSSKYSLHLMAKKNKLSDAQKEELRKNNLKVYATNLIINKAITVESILATKLKLSRSAIKNIDFQAKYLVFQSQYLTDTTEDRLIKNKIQLLQQIRNTLAHTDWNLNAIKDESMKKTFWKIIHDNESKDDIDFKCFDALMKYIASIDSLCNALEEKEMQQLPSDPHSTDTNQCTAD